MIVARNITKRFGRLTALNDVSVSFERGHCIALIGPNGSGKTTLIKAILGMVMPNSGSITFDGQPITRNPTYRNRIGYMPQAGHYPEAATIGQVIAMMKDIRGNVTKLDESLIQTFNLQAHYGKRTGTLSGGTRQKLSAALAFLFNPDVLILDEPTAGLDPLASELLKKKIVQEKERGKLIIITSHILSELDDLVSEVAYMQDGKLRFHTSLESLKIDTGEVTLSKAIAALMRQQPA